MRPDFNKVLTERPRQGHKRKHKEVRKAYNSKFNSARWDENEDGQYGGLEGMRKPYNSWIDRKQNTDLWSAIRRFMLSRCGQKWDDVWSEVNRDLHESDDMRAHWRVHCKIEVDEKVEVAPNGKLWRLASRGRWTLRDIEHYGWPLQGIPGCNKRFYVDPRDGILRKNPDLVWDHPAREEDQPEYGWRMPDGVIIKYIDGIWYDVSYTPRIVTERIPVYGPRVPGEFLRPVIRYDTVLRTTYDYEKRQLSSKELRRYGVSNS